MTPGRRRSDRTLTKKIHRIQESTEIFSYKWYPLIIYAVHELDGAGYSEIETVLDGISSKMLSDGLSTLCDRGILETTETVEGSGSTVYTLTDKGNGLVPTLHILQQWYDRYERADPVVLIVEDERMVADILSEYLSDSYEVRFVRTGKEALSEYDDDVDVVVLDRMLPGISGDGVATELKSQDEHALVLVVSSLEPDTDIFDLEADDYLQKPVTETEIRERLTLLLQRADLHAESRTYLEIRSKQAALIDAYGEVAKEMAEYQTSIDRLHQLDLPESKRHALESLIASQ